MVMVERSPVRRRIKEDTEASIKEKSPARKVHRT